MNPLQRLIHREMAAQVIERGELARRMGYSNINKGLRRLGFRQGLCLAPQFR